MTFYKTLAFTPSCATSDAEQFLRDTFDWSAPKNTWRPVIIKEMLQHFGRDASQSSCSVFGRVIRKLNGDMVKRSNGHTYTWLPPMKG